MVHFTDGVAAGRALALSRAPVFLRVVADAVGNIDALDQPDDVPTTFEKIYVYRRVRNDGVAMVCSRGRGCRTVALATYRLHDVQPKDGVLRDTARWQAWCVAEAEKGKGYEDATKETEN